MLSQVTSESQTSEADLWNVIEIYHSVPAGYIRAEGKIKNVNTVEDFKNMDKAAMLQTAAKQASSSLEVV